MAAERQVRTLAAALLLGAAACTEHGAARSGPAWLSASERPITLKPTIDAAAATSKVVTAANGGTLSATGKDGTRYRLSIPGGALLNDATITIVPLAKVEGLPLSGGSVAAVHIEPSGLQLMKAATLTIDAARDVPVAEQVAFAYYGGGNDAHRIPLSPDPRKVEMKLLHFSGYGFGQAPANDPGRQALERAHAAEARLQSRMAEILDRERQRQLKGEEAQQLSVELDAAAIEYYDTVLRPLMQRAESDDRLAVCCMQRYFGWERSLQMLGIERDGEKGAANAELERRRAEGDASAAKILTNAVEKGRERAVKACRDDHDLNAVARLMSLERQMQLLGMKVGDDGAKAWAEMQRCFQFSLEFDSEFDNHVEASQLYHHVRARATADLGTGSPKADGVLATAPLAYVQHITRIVESTLTGANGRPSVFQIFGAKRMDGIGTKNGTFSLHRIEWDTNPIEPAGVDCNGKDVPAAGPVNDSITVTFQTGVPTDIVRATYKQLAPQTMTNHTWSSEWTRHHEDAQVAELPSREDPDQPDPLYRMTLRRTEPGVWRADFTRPDRANTPGLSLAEKGYLIVRHTPR